MRVYLTGGSGLLGSHVAERLRARGDEVVCLLRKGSDRTFLEAIGCRIVLGNVKDGRDALSAGMAGCAAVVHAAAIVFVGGPWPRLRAVNVEGTANVLEAAAKASVPRALHVSSVAVYGRRNGAVTEQAPIDGPLPAADLYARSKREAEHAARAAAERGRIQLLLARPAVVYGERDRLFAPRLARVARLPVIPILGSGTNALPVLYAGNVADALIRILDAGRAGEAYNVGADGRITQRELLEGVARALGRRPRFVNVPAALVREAARVGGAVGLHLPGGGDMTLERLARLGLGENPYDSRRLEAELGWRPAITHDEGLRRTAEWLEREGL